MILLQVEENDGLPSKLCESCAVLLPKFFSFKSQCESADARLRHILQNTYSEIEIKYEVEMELEGTLEVKINCSFKRFFDRFCIKLTISIYKLKGSFFVASDINEEHYNNITNIKIVQSTNLEENLKKDYSVNKIKLSKESNFIDHKEKKDVNMIDDRISSSINKVNKS